MIASWRAEAVARPTPAPKYEIGIDHEDGTIVVLLANEGYCVVAKLDPDSSQKLAKKLLQRAADNG
jgi:hypothetical protein